MRLPKAAHTSRPWRVHELIGDFEAHALVYPLLLRIDRTAVAEA